MKRITANEFLQIGTKEQPPERIAARKIIDTFKNYRSADGEQIVIEVEESDFDNIFDFSNPKQLLRAATLLRNVANKDEDYSIAVKQRGKRLFVGMREEIEPGFRSWR